MCEDDLVKHGDFEEVILIRWIHPKVNTTDILS